jgi:hypothetical protein
MATVALDVVERRRERRWPGGGPRFDAGAVLRPGQAVVLINISSRAALVESATRLRPGAQTELQLCGSGVRAAVRGRVERCQVARLEPLRYHGVVLFDGEVDLGGDDGDWGANAGNSGE